MTRMVIWECNQKFIYLLKSLLLFLKEKTSKDETK